MKMPVRRGVTKEDENEMQRLEIEVWSLEFGVVDRRKRGMVSKFKSSGV